MIALVGFTVRIKEQDVMLSIGEARWTGRPWNQ